MTVPNGKLGELVECSDPAIREYILHINSKESESFVLHDIPPNHLFVKRGVAPRLIELVNQLTNEVTFNDEVNK